MALTTEGKKLVKLVAAVKRNPSSNRAWGALALEAPAVAESLRDVLVATGRMTLAQ